MNQFCIDLAEICKISLKDKLLNRSQECHLTWVIHLMLENHFSQVTKSMKPNLEIVQTKYPSLNFCLLGHICYWRLHQWSTTLQELENGRTKMSQTRSINMRAKILGIFFGRKFQEVTNFFNRTRVLFSPNQYI